ncbi:MAG: glycerate kinase [Thermovirgaceae bacterium]
MRLIRVNYFRNLHQLTQHGNDALRRETLDILNFALAKADPFVAARNCVVMEGEELSICGRTMDLSRFDKVYVIGAGKASFGIARALEEVLGPRITKGLVICKDGLQERLEHVEIACASHPVPNETSLRKAGEILDLMRQTGPRDLVIACITGGSSALMSLPVPEIPFEDKRTLNRILLTSGANILEINAVRKHASLVKGGRLAQAMHPGTLLINLTVSDVIGDPLDCITDPTVPDSTSFEDARRTLDKYGLWERVPETVAKYFRDPPPDRETPKSFDDRVFESFIIVPGEAASEGAAERARELGYETMILSTMFEGESRELGCTFGYIAKEIIRKERPLKRPCAVIGGGETVVTFESENEGLGGPNQEFALGAATEISRIGDVVVAGLDTDGTDGPTNFGGGIVDNCTVDRAEVLGLDIHTALKRHEVSGLLGELGDLLITGNTGTNVNDLKVMILR